MENKNNIPSHVAIIMDGNRRWAKEHKLPAQEGHKHGYERFKEIAKECHKMGVKILTVYAFSTENWKRSKLEVSYLMNLFVNALNREADFFRENGIKMNAIGQIDRFPKKIRDLVYKIKEETKNNKNGIVNIAISYGGRQEILDATSKIIKDKIKPEKLNEKVFANYLYASEQPDPDLIIRTGGEMRLSGFLTWQSIYSELYFSKKLWPDFSVNDLKVAVKEFQDRKRRFGK